MKNRASPKEVAARREANQKLIHELERQAGAWSRAQLFRRYLRAAKRRWHRRRPRQSRDRKVEFLAWAEHYVNQLDPLQPEPRDPDLMHETPTQLHGSPRERGRFEEELYASLAIPGNAPCSSSPSPPTPTTTRTMR